MNINIVEAFIKFNNQLVILISGISGSGISHLAKNMSKDLNIPSVSYAKYCIKNYDKKVSLPNNTEVINWDSDDVIDWPNFNKEIEDKKKTGVIAYSQAFPTKRLDKNLSVDFHINIKLSKQNLFTRRQKYIQEHKDECKDLYGRSDEFLIFNRLTYPYYLESVQNGKITKFINANEFSQDSELDYDEKLANLAFDYIINMINKWLENYNKNKNNKNNKENKVNDDSDSDSINDLEDEGYSTLY